MSTPIRKVDSFLSAVEARNAEIDILFGLVDKARMRAAEARQKFENSKSPADLEALAEADQRAKVLAEALSGEDIDSLKTAERQKMLDENPAAWTALAGDFSAAIVEQRARVAKVEQAAIAVLPEVIRAGGDFLPGEFGGQALETLRNEKVDPVLRSLRSARELLNFFQGSEEFCRDVAGGKRNPNKGIDGRHFDSMVGRLGATQAI